MVTRNAMCPYGCGTILLRTEDRGKVTYSEKTGKKHYCSAMYEEGKGFHGYVSDGCGCVERIW